MCIIDLTNVGEALVAELLKKNPSILGEKLELEHVKDSEYQVLSEISLAPVQIGSEKYSFDGMSRIDVGIIYTNQNGKRLCHPIELKLGQTRMANNDNDIGRFTQGYYKTHNNKRIGGSMISILGNKPSENNMGFQRNDICVNDEKINPNDERIVLSDKWTLIVRTETIAVELNRKNGFFKTQITNCNVLSFESLFEENTVNETMKCLLPKDGFYKYWELNNPNHSK